jgi:hypothetical protein
MKASQSKLASSLRAGSSKRAQWRAMLQFVAKTVRVKITVPEDVPAKIAATSGRPACERIAVWIKIALVSS